MIHEIVATPNAGGPQAAPSNTKQEAGAPNMSKKWYVIQTYSWYENKVKAALQ